jgi:7-keto-8-aminopelargonate synthetase-like enzyme
VQTGHALIEATRAFLAGDDTHPSVIVFGVKDENKLKSLAQRVQDQGIRVRPFYEPDIGNQMTAFATEPVFGVNREIFRKYQLL